MENLMFMGLPENARATKNCDYCGTTVEVVNPETGDTYSRPYLQFSGACVCGLCWETTGAVVTLPWEDTRLGALHSFN